MLEVSQIVNNALDNANVSVNTQTSKNKTNDDEDISVPMHHVQKEQTYTEVTKRSEGKIKVKK